MLRNTKVEKLTRFINDYPLNHCKFNNNNSILNIYLINPIFMKKNLLVTAILLFTLLGSMMAQTRTITGKVTSSEDGQPLPGANVVVVDRGIGTITDADGNYST